MRILCVCLGNICRSPTAEAVLRAVAAREAPGLLTVVDSAGTADYHRGEPPDSRSIEVARARGYELGHLRARQVSRADFTTFDLILAMDRANLADLHRLAPAAGTATLGLYLQHASIPGQHEVPDPYYGTRADFERVVDLAEAGARALLARLRQQAR